MDVTLEQMMKEVARAEAKYGPPTSTHESLGVLIEEVDELRQAIHDNEPDWIEYEATQVAAVAYRLASILARRDGQFRQRSGLFPMVKKEA